MYVLLASVLILAVIGVFYVVLLPRLHSVRSPEGVVHALVGAALSFNILFHYVCCVTTDPGKPPVRGLDSGREAQTQGQHRQS